MLRGVLYRKLLVCGSPTQSQRLHSKKIVPLTRYEPLSVNYTQKYENNQVSCESSRRSVLQHPEMESSE